MCLLVSFCVSMTCQIINRCGLAFQWIVLWFIPLWLCWESSSLLCITLLLAHTIYICFLLLGLIWPGYHLLHNCKQYTTHELQNTFLLYLFKQGMLTNTIFVLTKIFCTCFRLFWDAFFKLSDLYLDFDSLYFNLVGS